MLPGAGSPEAAAAALARDWHVQALRLFAVPERLQAYARLQVCQGGSASQSARWRTLRFQSQQGN